MSCLQWRPLRWSCATAVPPSPWEARCGVMWQPPGRRCCRGWGHRKWCQCRCQLMSLEGSCSCSAPILCALHCHTISHHCEHWRHCWRVYCCWNGWSSGCQTTEETTELWQWRGENKRLRKPPLYSRKSLTWRYWINIVKRLINSENLIPAQCTFSVLTAHKNPFLWIWKAGKPWVVCILSQNTLRWFLSSTALLSPVQWNWLSYVDFDLGYNYNN